MRHCTRYQRDPPKHRQNSWTLPGIRILGGPAAAVRVGTVGSMGTVGTVGTVGSMRTVGRVGTVGSMPALARNVAELTGVNAWTWRGIRIGNMLPSSGNIFEPASVIRLGYPGTECHSQHGKCGAKLKGIFFGNFSFFAR